MHRRTFLAGLAAGILLAAPALAKSEMVDDIVRQLEKRGYTSITVTETWLGRVRILAEGPKGSREIIVNPATGEILRDLKRAKGKDSSDLLDDDEDSDDDKSSGDDDSDDDSDDDDNSGSGSGDDSGGDNSGSGSGNSGGDDGGGDDD